MYCGRNTRCRRGGNLGRSRKCGGGRCYCRRAGRCGRNKHCVKEEDILGLGELET